MRIPFDSTNIQFTTSSMVFIIHFKTLQTSSLLSLDMHMILFLYNFFHGLNFGLRTYKMYRHFVCIAPHRAVTQSFRNMRGGI